jgi:hypothetical protein
MDRKVFYLSLTSHCEVHQRAKYFLLLAWLEAFELLLGLGRITKGLGAGIFDRTDLLQNSDGVPDLSVRRLLLAQSSQQRCLFL